MNTQISYPTPPGAVLLQATILDEIVGSQAAQVAIDELGLVMATHLGSKRDRNEDRIAVARIEALNTTYTVALVCDGVGGSQSGDQAAALAITSIIADLSWEHGRQSLCDLAVSLVTRADEFVRKELQGRGATTLVMLLATTSGELVCANVGDSRAYSWDPNSDKLDQVTIDDTIENELKNLPGNGVALINARRLQGQLSQAIGETGRSADELRVQVYTKERFHFGAVLGTDGLWRAAKDFELALANATTPTDAARRAIALANWVGGVDNASVIVVSDVERLCGDRQTQNSPDRRQTEIILWTSTTKIKIPIRNLLREGKYVETRSKPEKQKRNAKKKEPRETANAKQLELESVDSKEARPKIEVTINEESK